MVGNEALELVFRKTSRRAAIPKNVPCYSIDADQMPAEFSKVARIVGILAEPRVGGHEHAISNDDRTAYAFPRKWNRPLKVLGISPVSRDVPFVHTRSIGPTEL